MTDRILYLSMLRGLVGVYVLISSFMMMTMVMMMEKNLFINMTKLI